MAPSNLNQVFVANTANLVTSGSFGITPSTAATSKVGIWDNSVGKFIGDTGAAASLLTSGAFVSTLTDIQFVQNMPSGNPIATPLINVKDIRRIAFSSYKAATPYKTVAAIGTLMQAAATADQAVMMRFAIRTAPTSYASFSSPNDAALDISSDTTKYAFPIIGNFSAGRNIHSIEIPEVDHNNDEATFVTKAVTAINDHPYLKKVFFASGSSTDLTVEARHEGVIFDLTIQYSNGDAFGEGQTITANAGEGNYYQALSNEKACRSKYGNFNRMYFPMDFPTFAISGNAYNVIDISYEHAHPSSTGIARAAELNNVRIYLLDAASGSTTSDTTTGFGATIWDQTAGLTAEWFF
jgi:hypothetical protein